MSFVEVSAAELISASLSPAGALFHEEKAVSSPPIIRRKLRSMSTGRPNSSLLSSVMKPCNAAQRPRRVDRVVVGELVAGENVRDDLQHGEARGLVLLVSQCRGALDRRVSAGVLERQAR